MSAIPTASPIPTDNIVLELRNLHAGYGGIEVLHGVDLVLPQGNVLALLGPNGGGKSTTLKVIAGLLGATHGDVLLAGRPVTGTSADELARKGLCLIPEGRGIFPNLTVRKQLAGTMSGGEQQMLAMARALATEPAVLLLDELSMGLAPLIVAELYEIVAQVATQGVSILVVEQFARTVLGIADWAAIMLHGKVTSVGRPSELEAELTSAYLGA
jgi:branched-chain amino acid transport system ATP-binding protein